MAFLGSINGLHIPKTSSIVLRTGIAGVVADYATTWPNLCVFVNQMLSFSLCFRALISFETLIIMNVVSFFISYRQGLKF